MTQSVDTTLLQPQASQEIPRGDQLNNFNNNNNNKINDVNNSQQQMQTSKVTIPISLNPLSSSSSVSNASSSDHQSQNNNNRINNQNCNSNSIQTSQKLQQSLPINVSVNNINTEEFAKLDSLLEDLLAEVEQPILLNKQDGSIIPSWEQQQKQNGGISRSMSTTNTNNNNTNSNRSGDWLNDQKERLRNRKELVNAYQAKYTANEEVRRPQSSTGQRFKSKIDYFISNDYPTPTKNATSTSARISNNYNLQHLANSSTHSLGKKHQLRNNNNPAINNDNNNDQQQQEVLNENDANNSKKNKPPVSPNPRSMSVNSQQPPHSAAAFRSLSINPGASLGVAGDEESSLLDENRQQQLQNIMDLDSNRKFSEKSSYEKSVTVTNTVQRSKYHTVSNDYVECTRPTAATPIPTYQKPNKMLSKRALSAPPTEIGKIMLERMELCSPVNGQPALHPPTGSVVPFIEDNDQLPQQHQLALAAAQSQSHPQRNVFLNQKKQLQQAAQNGEQQQRVSYTNGYETDSALTKNQRRPYHYSNTTARSVYPSPGNKTTNFSPNHHPQLPYSESQPGFASVPPPNTTNSNNNSMNSSSYRTLSSYHHQPRSYNAGYETDSGVNQLSQNRQRPASRNAFYRSVTPSNSNPNNININAAGGGGYMSDSSSLYPGGHNNNNNNPTPVAGYPAITENSQIMSYTQQQQNQIQAPTPQPQQIQYIDSNGNVTSGIPAFVHAEGNQIIIQEINPNNLMQYNNNNNTINSQHKQQQPNNNNNISLTAPSPANSMFNGTTTSNGTEPTSLIIHQQVAPSAYSRHQTLTPQPSINSCNDQQQQELPQQTMKRNGSLISTSGTNLSSLSQQQQKKMNQSMSQQLSSSNKKQIKNSEKQQQEIPARRASISSSIAPTSEQEISPKDVLKFHPKSIKATQHFWYKSKISRDEAIGLLKDKAPGTFLIRDSNNFPGAYGLALKVDKPPLNLHIKKGQDPSNELVRHFLIEPTTKGVRIKGCCNEPIFASLAALVYQHSLTSLALPIKLILPTQDLNKTATSRSCDPTKTDKLNDENNSSNRRLSSSNSNSATQLATTATSNSESNSISNSSSQQQQIVLTAEGKSLLEKGAACNVYYLNTVTVEDKVGLDAITFALKSTKTFTNKDASQLLLIQFKVTAQGITLTDLNRKKFLRHNYPVNTVLYCVVDETFTWPHKLDKIAKPRIFGVICKSRVTDSNECHLFVEMDTDQPAIAIVDFVNRYLIPSKLSS